jgi:cell division protease FtsH
VLNDISTGASNDLERATKLAQDMVTKYGMTDAVGPVNYSNAGEVFLGQDYTTKRNYSEELASAIDTEVRLIMDEAYQKTEELIRAHREELDRVAAALLELETLDAEQFEAVYTGTKTIEELKADLQETTKERKAKEAIEARERAKREEEQKSNMEHEFARGRRVAVFDAKGRPVIKDMGDYMKEKEKPAEEAPEAKPAEVLAEEKPEAKLTESSETPEVQPAEAPAEDSPASPEQETKNQ